MWTLVDHVRKIVRHRRWIQRPGIVIALLLIDVIVIVCIMANHIIYEPRQKSVQKAIPASLHMSRLSAVREVP